MLYSQKFLCISLEHIVEFRWVVHIQPYRINSAVEYSCTGSSQRYFQQQHCAVGCTTTLREREENHHNILNLNKVQLNIALACFSKATVGWQELCPLHKPQQALSLGTAPLTRYASTDFSDLLRRYSKASRRYWQSKGMRILLQVLQS